MNQMVLIVEDSKTQQEAITACVEKFGFVVHTAANAEEALEKCIALKFAVILMDINLPTIDGFECCQRLRTREYMQKLPRTPVVAVTSCDIDDKFKRAYQFAGMDDYLAKPFEAEALRKILLRYTYSPKVPNLRLLPRYTGETEHKQPG